MNALAISLQIGGFLISVIALFVAVIGTRDAKRIANLALSKADKDEKYEISALLWATKELLPKVKILDDYIFKNRVFTRRQAVLDALEVIKKYWTENGAAIAHHLGKENREYKTLRGLYEIALENENNQPPPNGMGEWRGITPDHLHGLEVEQIVRYAVDELEKKAKKLG
jgi:hypothetical protein